MSLEIILDILLSAIVLMVYRADCQQQPSLVYACVSSEMLIFGHQEYAATRFVNPEDYESTTHLVTPDDVWVADPMDATPELDDLTLGELFAAANAIIPMEPEVAAELQAIDRKINQVIHSSGQRVKGATVVQLRALLKEIGWDTRGTKANINDRLVRVFADRDSILCRAIDTRFILSDDKQSVLVLLK